MNDRKAEACERLVQKQKELSSAGISRYPQRSDFSGQEVAAIKAALGPWPRALEAAGLKPPREGDRIARNREKRARAKARRSAEMRADAASARPEAGTPGAPEEKEKES